MFPFRRKKVAKKSICVTKRYQDCLFPNDEHFSCTLECGKSIGGQRLNRRLQAWLCWHIIAKHLCSKKTLNWSNNIGNIVMALIKQLVWQRYLVNKLQLTCTGRYMLVGIWEQYVNVDLSLWLVMIALLLSHILIEHILKRLRLV